MRTTLKPLVVGAPFGNYIGEGWATRTLGSFTLENRGGLLYRMWRVLKTVRYYPGIKAWKNKLGLPNPGIAWLEDRITKKKVDVSDKIVSVFGFTPREGEALLHRAAVLSPLAVELNVSCPNVKHKSLHRHELGALFLTAHSFSKESPVIVKLPPVGYREMVEVAIKNGVTLFHCCNTLTTPGGGLSGKPLKTLSLDVIRYIRDTYPDANIRIIGGGGVSTLEDVHEYMHAGADRVAIASCLFNPLNIYRMRSLAPHLNTLAQNGVWGIGANHALR